MAEKEISISLAEKRKIHKSVARMICVDSQAYSMVERQGFQDFIDENIPKSNYKLPCRTTISRTYVPQLYCEMERNIRNELSTFMDDVLTVSFTSDCWKSRAGDHYISLTLHVITNDFQLKSYTLGNNEIKESHTAEHLRSYLTDMVAYWNLPVKSTDVVTVFISTDNARNVTAAVKLIPSWIHIRCFNHTLDLAVDDAKTGISFINNLFSKCKKIVGRIRKSDPVKKALDDTQREMGMEEILCVLQLVETRWGSELKMARRLAKLRVPLSKVLKMKHLKCKRTLSETEWDILEMLVHILEPLNSATEDMGGSYYPTLSMAIPVLHGIDDALDSFMDKFRDDLPLVIRQYVGKLKKALDIRFNSIKANNLYRKAMVLDPRFRCLLMDESEIKSIIDDITAEILYRRRQKSACILDCEDQMHPKKMRYKFLLITKVEKEKELQSFATDQVRKQVELYVKENVIPVNACVYTWWKENQRRFPVVAKVASRYLAVQASSVQSERLFSMTGNIVTPKRKRLLPKHVTQLSLLATNLRRRKK